MFGAILAGCGSPAVRPATDVPRSAPADCDVRPAAESLRRAWFGHEPVIVVDVQGPNVEVAAIGADTLVERWVPIAALGRAVITETAVSPRPRSPGDPALRVLPGFPLAAASTTWTAVHGTGTIAFDGFVPSDVRGMIWVEPPSFSGSAVQMSFEVRAEARVDAPVRARIHPGTMVRAARGSDEHWIPITASASHARVEGFVERPPPLPPRPGASEGGVEFSEIEVDGVGTEWIPIGTCLWDAPGGHIAGAITAPLLTRPRAEANGWAALAVHTPWGEVTYHAHAPVVDPPVSEPAEWGTFDDGWRGYFRR